MFQEYKFEIKYKQGTTNSANPLSWLTLQKEIEKKNRSWETEKGVLELNNFF